MKILRFFGVDIDVAVPYDVARDLIGQMLSENSRRSLWERYVYLTRDLDASSPLLKGFDPKTLPFVKLPRGWRAEVAERTFRKKMAAKIRIERGLFDSPQPDIVVRDRVFMFGGQFRPGVRERCEAAVLERGGLTSRSVGIPHSSDYFVVGESTRLYDRHSHLEIDAALVDRETYGKPAIVTQRHWNSYL